MPVYNLRDYSQLKYNHSCSLSEQEMDEISSVADLLNIHINPPLNVKNTDFKPTKMMKKEENKDNIRKYLNKITDKNYKKYKTIIIDYIKNINTSESANEIGLLIFTIATSNTFYSDTYALLYKDLIQEYDFMKDILNKHFDSFLEMFDNIQCGDPNKDYNKFCEINKINDKRKSVCGFYINLMKNSILDINKIVFIILKLMDKFDTFSTDKNSTFLCEEILENLNILISEGHTNLKESKEWNQIYKFIIDRRQVSIKDYPGFTNKIKFKLMDIMDNII